MADALPFEIEEVSDRLFIHFNVEDHFLSLSTFIRTADSARKVVEALDRMLFSGSGGFEVIVLPPTEGTFGQSLGIQPKHLTVLAVAGFLCTAQGEAFTKGLTGQTTTEWFEDAGVAMRESIDWAVEKLAGNDDLSEETSEPSVHSRLPEAACRVAVQLVTTMTREILEADTVDLLQAAMDIGDLPDALEARAEFYEACYNDPDVKSIGFTPDDHFPIPRNSFPERAQKPVRKKKEEDEPEWLVSQDVVRVDSPTWDQDKQRSRKWLGVDQQNRTRYFVIEDAEFWERIRKKELHFEGSDRLAVQWAYQIVGGKAKNRRVLRVLEFNGDTLAEPLSGDAIAAMLGRFSTVEASRSTPSLLDFMDE